MMTIMSSSSSNLLRFVVDSHPNDVSVQLPTEWQSIDWKDVLNPNPPSPLRTFLRDLAPNQLPRDSTPITGTSQSVIPTASKGVSPQKIQQIYPFAAHLAALFPACPNIVDVGAGKAHLTRLLAAANPAYNLLALDQHHYDGDVPRQTVKLDTPSLIQSVDAWASSLQPPHGQQQPCSATVPVVLVALHACGSLTVDALRAFLHPPSQHFHLAGALLVGCCYNLLRPGDFPLSDDSHYPAYPLIDHLPRPLPESAFHMACQIPHLWHTHMPKAELAVQKVVWRAILARILQTEVDQSLIRLGKLPKRAYHSYSDFLHVCAEKLGMQYDILLNASNRLRLDDGEHLTVPPQPPQKLANQLAVLHVLRCLAGPVIESWIILDRKRWIERLIGHEWHVQLVNLFPQAEASPRNVAIMVRRLE
jgi:hypothetical protein